MRCQRHIRLEIRIFKWYSIDIWEGKLEDSVSVSLSEPFSDLQIIVNLGKNEDYYPRARVYWNKQEKYYTMKH